MIRDKKGEGGFLEALTALMVVTVALTSFLGMLSYSELGNAERSTELDTSFIDALKIEEGRIVGETQYHLERFAEKNGLNGVRLDVSVAGNACGAYRSDSIGTEEGNNVSSIFGTFSIDTDGGGTYAATYEVVYWWD